MTATEFSGEGSASSRRAWSFPEKLFFRFFFCYFLLYILPFPFSRVPIGWSPDQLFASFYHWLVPLTGEVFFGITHELTLPGGSGDTTFSYLQVFAQLGLALIFSLVWTLVDRKRSGYHNLFRLLLVFLRYFLGFTMLSYGISKIFVNQFAEISLFDLIKPYGASSPMGLMWNFMEYSGSYSVFSGLAEFVGGLLLFFRRTTKLGALIVFAVMLNVFLLNMSYDIPVKLFSFHLMFMATFILIPYLPGLLNFFVRNKPVLPEKQGNYFTRRNWNRAGYAVKAVFVLHTLIVIIGNGMSSRRTYGNEAPRPALYGIYEVQQHIRNNDTLPPLLTDRIRWNKLVIDKYSGGIMQMNEEIRYVQYEVDTTSATLSLIPRGSETGIDFKYRLEQNRLYLESEHEAQQIKIELLRKDREDFPLLNRGFHWINEYPYNM